MSQQPLLPGQSDTIAALENLDLGGKTVEEAEAEQLALKAQISSDQLEEEKKAEEAEEALPISRKDQTLN